MNLGRRLLIVGWLLGSLFCCMAQAAPPALQGKVLILGAASTTDALEQARAEFTRQHPEVTVRSSFGASSALAQQIAAGVEADLFLSASTEWAEFLQKKELVDRQRNLLGNQLVVIVPTDTRLELRQPADLLQAGVLHVALADPRAVPAGIYAKQALEKLNLWAQLEKKVAGASDVRQALHFVETGAAEAGIVYATDAAASTKVRVALRIDSALSEPIRYPLVLLPHGAKNPAAVAFYEFLASPAAAEIFRKHGFLPPEPPKPQ